MLVLIKNSKNKTLTKTEIQNLNISNSTIKIYNNIPIRKELKNFLKPLAKPEIETIKFSDEKKNILSFIHKKNALDFLNQPNEEINKSTNTFVKYYHIKSLTFDKGKWKLYDDASTITALIEDKRFIQKVERQSVGIFKR